MANNFKRSARFGIALSILLFLFMFARSNNRQYVSPNSDYYQVVTVNGSPFLQKGNDPYGYGQPQYAQARPPERYYWTNRDNDFTK